MHETWHLTGLEATIYLYTFGSNHHLYQKSGQAMLESGVTSLAHTGRGSASYSLPTQCDLKKTDFVDTMSPRVLHDLWFSLNQSPESAYH
jgi:hypothetical protein